VVSNSPVSRRVRSPSWLDLRLVAGIGLVLVSVLIGVRVVSSADHTTRFWVADHDLSAGVILHAGDLHSVALRLPSASTSYYPVDSELVGKALNRPIGRDELIPRSALESASAATTVTIPLGGDNAPRISAGQRITVWVSTKLCPSATVLTDVAVQSVQTTRGGALSSAGGEDVIVRVSPDLALRVVQALALDGGVLRAGVIDGTVTTSGELSDLTRCAPSGS
jgi:hypothetical protein